MNVDDKIKLLKEEIARLEKSKNVDESILTKTGDFKIKVYSDDGEKALYFSTFKELFDFWKKHMSKTDYIFLESYNTLTKKWDEFTADNENEFTDLVKELSTYNAQRLSAMDFTICKRDGRYKFMAYIVNDFLKFFYDTMNEPIEYFKSKMTEEEYWKKIDEGKKYQLKFN